MHPKYTPKQLENYWSRVDKSGDCWLWRGRVDADGYGHYSVWHKGGPKIYSAHRLAWELTNGPIPDGLKVLHNCPDGDNPACVNPAHLWLGTTADNNRDAKAKGRTASGDRNGSRLHPERQVRGESAAGAVLREADVLDIRRRMASGEITQRAIASEYGVSKHAIYSIVRRKTWRHI